VRYLGVQLISDIYEYSMLKQFNSPSSLPKQILHRPGFLNHVALRTPGIYG